MLDIYNVLELINMNVLNSKMLLLLVHLDVPLFFFLFFFFLKVR